MADPQIIEASLEQLRKLAWLREQVAEKQRRLTRSAAPRPRPWHDVARPDQIVPKDCEAYIHLFMAGRGWGKSFVGSNWLAEQAATHPDTEWAVIAPTWRACEMFCINGSSGVLRALLPGEVESTNLSALTIRLTNGSTIYGYTADKPDRLRGANLSGAWVDELAAMGHADDLWGEALIPALRIGKKPQVVVTTTPRPVKLLRELLAREDGSVRVVRGKMWDNAANLSKTMLTDMMARYDGTRLGRQELDGELIEDVIGALWNRELLDETRVNQAPSLSRIVIGVDPAVTSGEKSDYTGIVAVGKGNDGHLYVLEDATMKGTPRSCMAKAVSLYNRWSADRIVAEVNNGADYISSVLRTVDPNVPFSAVRATRGKFVRAEPISALWEQKRGHIVGSLPTLEDQMCSFTTDTKESPDNLDSCVWAATELNIGASALPYLIAISSMCTNPACGLPNGRRATVCTVCGSPLESAA